MALSFFEPSTEVLTIPSATPVLSKKYEIKKFATACFHIEYDATFAATFRVLGALKNTSTFADTGIFVSAAELAAGASMANLSGLGCAYVQFEVTATTGTGTMTLMFGAKESS